MLFRMGKWFDWLNKRKAVKATTKWNERNVLWIWMQKRCTFYVEKKKQFLKAKSAFKTGLIAAHENLDVINMTI